MYIRLAVLRWKALMREIVVVALALGVTHEAWAQCKNDAVPNCSVYTQCFAKYCPCSGDTEYFETYGAKYCQRFLDNANFSAEGKKWREKTLICLQETIVPRLDISTHPVCNCGTMKKFAFDSHVACYTQKDASICALPMADVNEIRKVVDIADTFSSEGWKQMAAVARICEVTAPDDGRRTAWKALSVVLSLR